MIAVADRSHSTEVLKGRLTQAGQMEMLLVVLVLQRRLPRAETVPRMEMALRLLVRKG